MITYTTYNHYIISDEDRKLKFINSYYINSEIIQEPSQQLQEWITKFSNNRLRKNAKIPQEYTNRINTFEQWKNNMDPEELKVHSNRVLFEHRFDAVEQLPSLINGSIYYAAQYEKEKCNCKWTKGLIEKKKCIDCVESLTVYQSDEFFLRLTNVFSSFEDITLDEIQDTYILFGKNYEASRDAIMAEHDIEESQLPAEVIDIEDVTDIEVVVGSKRNREVYDEQETVEPPQKIAAIEGLEKEFRECIQRALYYSAVDEKIKQFKNTIFVDEGAYQANPFAFV